MGQFLILSQSILSFYPILSSSLWKAKFSVLEKFRVCKHGFFILWRKRYNTSRVCPQRLCPSQLLVLSSGSRNAPSALIIMRVANIVIYAVVNSADHIHTSAHFLVPWSTIRRSLCTYHCWNDKWEARPSKRGCWCNRVLQYRPNFLFMLKVYSCGHPPWSELSMANRVHLVEFGELQVLCISDTLPMVVTSWFCIHRQT